MSESIKLTILRAHRENLLAAKTFEAYKAAHIAYVEYLIEDLAGKEKSIDGADSFLYWTLEKRDV